MLCILWRDKESFGYTDQIKSEWYAHKGKYPEITHPCIGPRSGRYQAKCDIRVKGAAVDCNYERYKEFNNRQGMLLGVTHIQFTDSNRHVVKQVYWKGLRQKRFEPCSTKVTFVPEDEKDESDFDEQVAQSSRLSLKERRQRLSKAPKTPASTQVVTTVYARNPDVVAEVLYRAAGNCEGCKKRAPFKRAKDGGRTWKYIIANPLQMVAMTR